VTLGELIGMAIDRRVSDVILRYEGREYFVIGHEGDKYRCAGPCCRTTAMQLGPETFARDTYEWELEAPAGALVAPAAEAGTWELSEARVSWTKTREEFRLR
jgi:hypothetical protein